MTTTEERIRDRYGLDTGRPAPAEMPPAITGLLSRRCIRRYTDRPVPPDLLDTLLACAQSAPTKSNLQQYAIVVTEDEAARLRLAELCPATGHMKYCPVFLTFCADIRRGRRLAGKHGLAFAADTMDTFLNAVVDAAMAMQCFVSAAEAAGLGCAPISDVRNRIADFSAALGLSPGVFPVAGMTVGWPAWEGRMNPRLPPEVVVHRETYDDTGLEDEIDAYDRRRAALQTAGADAPAWSEGAARHFAAGERADFRDFLLGHGFALA